MLFFLTLCHTGTVLWRACKQTVILSSLCLRYMRVPAAAWLMFCGGGHANGWAWFRIYTTIKLRFRSGRVGVVGVGGCKLRASFWEVIPTNKINIWLYKRGSSCTLTRTHKRCTDHDECPLKNVSILKKKNTHPTPERRPLFHRRGTIVESCLRTITRVARLRSSIQ